MSGAASILRSKRRWAAAFLWAEALAPALGPSMAILVAFVCAAWLGLLAMLPAPGGLVLLAGCLITATWTAWRLARRTVQPEPRDVDRRLERGDAYRPLTTLGDQPAFGGTEAVWQAHRERAMSRVAGLRTGGLQISGGERAAWGGGLAALAVCLAVAGPAAPARLWHALTPPLGLPPAPVMRVQAWIVPPAQTGLPPLFLRESLAGDKAAGKDDDAAVTAPAGSRLNVSVTGGARAPLLAINAARQSFVKLDHGSFQATALLDSSGVVEVSRGGTRLARWILSVGVDQPPAIKLGGAASVADGRLVVPWSATDDYGLAAVRLELRRVDRPQAAPLRLEMKLAGLPRSAKGGRLPDLAANPWAGSAVLLRYVARDGGGLEGATPVVLAVLPERAFRNPLARAVIEVRRGLARGDTRSVAAARALDRLSGDAAGSVSNGQWLNMRAIAALLAGAPGDVTAGDEAILRLWQLALAIEDAGAADAKQRLAAARSALQQALAAPTSPAQQRRIEALSQQLQQAMQQYLQSMQQQAAQSGQQPKGDKATRAVDASELQRMAQQMSKAAAAGRLADAQARLQELGALLDSLKAERGQTGQSGKAKSDPELEKLTREQSGLQQHSEQRLSDDADPRAGAAPGRDPDEAASQPDPQALQRLDAAAQAELRRRLGELAGKLGEQTGSVPDGLAKADGAMRAAEGALAKGDDAEARAAQQRAVAGLRAGSEDESEGNSPGGKGLRAGVERPGGSGAGMDPFGRAMGKDGQAQDDGSTLPVNGDAASGRALRDELRRRGADRKRPQPELDYIERLLKSE